MKRLLLALIAGLLIGPPASGETLSMATCNIANLHHESGVPLRDGAAWRDGEDYMRLEAIGEDLNVDIVALQEIGSPAALARIFPDDRWHLFISDRYVAGSENDPAGDRDIYTALALSKERFSTSPLVETVDALSLRHLELGRDGAISDRPTRAAMALETRIGGAEAIILNVHLKSSCHGFSLDPVEDQSFTTGRPFGSRFDCRTLAAQRAILENWIELQTALGKKVIVVGDFNRRLNQQLSTPARDEHFWADLSDGTPDGLSLAKGSEGKDTICWPEHKRRFEENIDFIVYDRALEDVTNSIVIAKRGLGHDKDPKYAGYDRAKLSDHCPVVGRFEW